MRAALDEQGLHVERPELCQSGSNACRLVLTAHGDGCYPGGLERLHTPPWGRARADHDHRRLVDRARELAVEREPRLGVEDHPAGLARDGLDPGGEQRIVGQRGADPDRHGVDLRAPAVRTGAAVLARDPARVARAGGDLAVERHRGLQGHERLSGPGVLAERLIDEPRPVGHRAVQHVHGDSLVAQDAEPPAAGLRRRIVGGDDHPRDPRRDDRLRARRRVARVAARLERDVQGGSLGALVARLERSALGVGLADRSVESLADHPVVLHDHRADKRVRAGPAAGLPS